MQEDLPTRYDIVFYLSFFQHKTKERSTEEQSMERKTWTKKDKFDDINDRIKLTGVSYGQSQEPSTLCRIITKILPSSADSVLIMHILDPQLV